MSTKSSSSLSTSWDDLALVRAKFLENAFLSRRTDGWLRETEITHGEQGWHVHDHYLLFVHDLELIDRLRVDAVDRWMASATRAGVEAGPYAAHAQFHKGTRERLNYITKGLMIQKPVDASTGPQGHSPADLLALYKAGDADAAERWQELENLFLRRRRWRASGGLFAPRNRAPRN